MKVHVYDVAVLYMAAGQGDGTEEITASPGHANLQLAILLRMQLFGRRAESPQLLNTGCPSSNSSLLACSLQLLGKHSLQARSKRLWAVKEMIQGFVFARIIGLILCAFSIHWALPPQPTLCCRLQLQQAMCERSAGSDGCNHVVGYVARK